jgi:hypothetical protein
LPTNLERGRDLVTSSQRRGGCEVGESSRGGEGGIEERLINRDGSDMCPEVAHIGTYALALEGRGRRRTDCRLARSRGCSILLWEAGDMCGGRCWDLPALPSRSDWWHSQIPDDRLAPAETEPSQSVRRRCSWPWAKSISSDSVPSIPQLRRTEPVKPKTSSRPATETRPTTPF